MSESDSPKESAGPFADEATAFHEAGHAVVALVLQRPVTRVSVLPDRHALGECFFGKPVFRPSEDWLEREVLIALAGLAAEAMRTGEYGWPEASRDLRYARSLTLRRAGNERQAERLEKRLLSKAEHLLSKPGHWQAVERLAAELLEHGVVSGRTARHLFERCLREAEE
jgi:ATP-dependent Zn protease